MTTGLATSHSTTRVLNPESGTLGYKPFLGTTFAMQEPCVSPFLSSATSNKDPF